MALYTDRNPVFNATEWVIGKLKEPGIEIIQTEIYRRQKNQYKSVAWVSYGTAA